MAPLKPSKQPDEAPSNITPRRSHRNSSSIIIDSPTATEPSPVRITPSRGGQKRNYYTLHHHGFSGPSLPVPDIQSTPPTKRARINQARKAQAIAIESENEEVDSIEQDIEEDSQVEKKSRKKV